MAGRKSGGASDVDAVIQAYAAAATPELIARYDSFDSAVLYQPVLDLLPTQPVRVVDIGAGTGRDAAWLASLGHSVLAVEPVGPLRLAGQALHGGEAIQWIDDRLPDLPVAVRKGPFDVIIAYGVLQHLDLGAQKAALDTMGGLLADAGVIILALRHGPGAAGRPVFPHPMEELAERMAGIGLKCLRKIAVPSIQPENRAKGVHWTWLVVGKA